MAGRKDQMVTPDLARSFGLKEARAALVANVIKKSPAEKVGIKQGDVILNFDGKDVKTSNDLPWIVAETPVGKTVDVKLLRRSCDGC